MCDRASRVTVTMGRIMLLGWTLVRKLLRVRPKANGDQRSADARPVPSLDDIAREVAKQDERRLAILEDYGRTLGY